jgi:hypothetical protein
MNLFRRRVILNSILKGAVVVTVPFCFVFVLCDRYEQVGANRLGEVKLYWRCVKAPQNVNFSLKMATLSAPRRPWQ